ncbi:MAG: NAD-dependent epimerase/dehydratase family protein [Candidatus Aenigmatarchaeota archaeon]
MNKILITGGAGFIGFNLLKKILMNTNYSVIIIDNLVSKSAKYNIKEINRLFGKYHKRLIFLKFDIGKSFFKELLRLTKDIQLIIHLAAELNQIKAVNNPLKIFRTNVIGTLNILEISKKFSSPIIFSSSIKVYSDWLNELEIREKGERYFYLKIKCINENFILDKNSRSRGIYGLTKYLGEQMCQEYHNLFNIPIIINRKSTIYGPYQHGTSGYGWLWHFMESAIKNNTINIFGNGKQVRDPLFINDLTDLYLRQIEFLLDKSNSKIFEVYNIGGGYKNSLSLLEAIKYIECLVGKKIKVNFLPPRHSDLKIWITDIGKVKSHFNWVPKTNIKRGLKILYNNLNKVAY